MHDLILRCLRRAILLPMKFNMEAAAILSFVKTLGEAKFG